MGYSWYGQEVGTSGISVKGLVRVVRSKEWYLFGHRVGTCGSVKEVGT